MTWQEVEAARAAEAANSLELNARVYSLPPGYLAGFRLSLSQETVTISVGIADVNGIFVRRTDSHILEGEDWDCHKVASYTYYIYIDREANYHIDPIESEFSESLFGKYHPVNLYRYIGKFTTDASNVIDYVFDGDAISSKGLEANAVIANSILAGAVDTNHLAAEAVTAAKILADTITANEIDADTITAVEIAVATLQAQFMRIVGSVTIGYEGTGTIASPDEGDRRIYIDGDEISFVE